MKVKVLKLVPIEYINRSRDIRELSVLLELGCEVVVLAKESKNHIEYEYPVKGLNTRPLRKWISSPSINRFASLFTWAKATRREKAQIISCHDIICLFIGWLSTIGQKNKPMLVYDSHEFEYARNENRSKLHNSFIKHLERFLIKRSAMTMMVDDSIAEEVKKLHSLDFKPVVVRNFPYRWTLDESVVTQNRKSFREEHQIPEDATVFIYHGGLIPNRGLENAIKAIANVDGAYLLILGNSQRKAYYDELKQMAAESAPDRIIFHPAVPYSELWKYPGIADVGLCILENVCLNHYYALPNKFSEYIQCLVPPIVSNFPELKLLTEKYNIGELCDPDDVSSLTGAMKKLQGDKALLATYKKHLVKAKNELCWEEESKVLKDAYLPLISAFSK